MEAKRRQVTVLFADVVGFAAFSERSGEEAAYTLMRGLSKRHRVPLARQSLAIIRELQEIADGGPWLFLPVRSIARPISENTLNPAPTPPWLWIGGMCADGFEMQRPPD